MTPWWAPWTWGDPPAPSGRTGTLYYRGFAWDKVDGPSWHGWEGPLDEPHRDIVAMRAHLRPDDYRILFDADATIKACEAAVRELWPVAKDGDNVLVDASGHGGDDLPGDPAEPRSEYVCAWDGPWPEWQIQALVRGFRPGVRVVFLLDTCNSGGFAKDSPAAPFASVSARMPKPKMVPPEIAALISDSHAALFRAIRAAKKAGAPKGAAEPLSAFFSAAEEGTPAYDGVFHREVIAAMRRGVTWNDTLRETRRRIGNRQRPNFDAVTAAGAALLNMRVPL